MLILANIIGWLTLLDIPIIYTYFYAAYVFMNILITALGLTATKLKLRNQVFYLCKLDVLCFKKSQVWHRAVDGTEDAAVGVCSV